MATVSTGPHITDKTSVDQSFMDTTVMHRKSAWINLMLLSLYFRSQLDYESFLKNYDMNIKFQLRKFGILPASPSKTQNIRIYIFRLLEV